MLAVAAVAVTGQLPARRRRGVVLGRRSSARALRRRRQYSRPNRPSPKPARQVHSHHVRPLSCERAVERQQRDERDQPHGRADLDRAHTVDVERLDVGNDVGAVADLVLPRLVVPQLHVPHVFPTSARSDRPVTQARRPGSPFGPPRVDGFFQITERGSTVGQEVRGGVVTFFTMAYIVVLNPLILGFARTPTGSSSAAATPRQPRRRSRPARRWSPG